MADIVDKATRSRMMSGIRGKNTRPEIIVRKALFSMGYRFRLHRKDLPGKPDIVLPKKNTAIFINGCFWHAHEGCRYAKLPETRKEFWRERLLRNKVRDAQSRKELKNSGWRVLTIWECFIRSSEKIGMMKPELESWIEGSRTEGNLEDIVRYVDRPHLHDLQTPPCTQRITKKS